jgi:hypothetical protein
LEQPLNLFIKLINLKQDRVHQDYLVAVEVVHQEDLLLQLYLVAQEAVEMVVAEPLLINLQVLEQPTLAVVEVV